eukprot:scaffold6058_cov159-Isochrysis_galbana.AAC.5
MRGVERAPHEALLDLLSREAVGFLERRPHAWRLGLGEPAEDRLEAGVVPAVLGHVAVLCPCQSPPG